MSLALQLLGFAWETRFTGEGKGLRASCWKQKSLWLFQDYLVVCETRVCHAILDVPLRK